MANEHRQIITHTHDHTQEKLEYLLNKRETKCITVSCLQCSTVKVFFFSSMSTLKEIPLPGLNYRKDFQ